MHFHAGFEFMMKHFVMDFKVVSGKKGIRISGMFRWSKADSREEADGSILCSDTNHASSRFLKSGNSSIICTGQSAPQDITAINGEVICFWTF